MKTPDYLDKTRACLNLPSDYALQRPLNLTKSQISRYRQGHDVLSDATALKIAELTGIPAEKILLDCQLERAKTPEIRALWENILENFSQMKPNFDFFMSVGHFADKSMVCHACS